MSYQVQIHVDQGAIQNMMHSPSGMVGAYLYRLALQTANEARTLAPRKSGKLASSILVRRGTLGSVEITANVPYAMVVHEGSKAHDVQAKPGHVMKFPSRKTGGVVYASKVHEPAHKGNPFLVNALRHTISMRV